MDSMDKTRGVVSSAERAWSWAAVTSARESAGLSWYVPCKLMQARTLAMNCRSSSACIIGPERTHLIDLALARGGHVPEGYDFPFRGCLVHYEAPEIARSVLATGEAEPTQEADIYALGASLLISATGWRAVEYPNDAPRPVQREAVADGRRRPVKAPGELIDAMLSHAPEDRPTIYEVGKALSCL